ncbi:MAG: diadenylate cyclase CdaA [Flavobacteriaceae bacterium]
MDFLNFSFIDIIDIVLVAILLYYVYKLLKGTVAINIFIGIMILLLIWQVTKALKMELLSNILGGFMGVGSIALIVVFQPEMRKFLLMLGSTKFSRRGGLMSQFKFLRNEITSMDDIESILEACFKLSKSKTGALIAIERNNKLDFVKESGDLMNLEVNAPILESIFFKNSPLHDGAVIVQDNHITAARCVFPLSAKQLPARFGLRHRAAIGITERTDCLCLTVSEETGELNYIKDGEFVLYKNQSDLTEKIKGELI